MKNIKSTTFAKLLRKLEAKQVHQHAVYSRILQNKFIWSRHSCVVTPNQKLAVAVCTVIFEERAREREGELCIVACLLQKLGNGVSTSAETFGNLLPSGEFKL